MARRMASIWPEWARAAAEKRDCGCWGEEGWLRSVGEKRDCGCWGRAGNADGVTRAAQVTAWGDVKKELFTCVPL
jgi:hypothetical protein